MGWNDRKIDQLKKLWTQGYTTAEIGKKLDVSKNAVVGKAHRLGLAGRPSPIKREEEEAAPKRTSKMAKNTKKSQPVLPTQLSSSTVSPTVTSKDKSKTPAVTIEELTSEMCHWPFGDPRDGNFNFCGKKTFQKKSYCLEHCAMAYTAPKNKQTAPDRDGRDGDDELMTS